MLRKTTIMLLGTLGLAILAPAAMAGEGRFEGRDRREVKVVEQRGFEGARRFEGERRFEAPRQIEAPRGRWVVEERKVQQPGHWETFERVECVPAHYETQTVTECGRTTQIQVLVPESKRTVTDRRWVEGPVVIEHVRVFQPEICK
jgi:hypothetical protein